MKTIKSYKIFVLAGVIATAMWVSSCLKDDRVDFTKLGNVVEMLDAAAGASTALSLTPGTDAIVMVRVNQAGPDATAHDIVITLGISQAAVDLYNLDTLHVVGTLLPDSAFSFPATVTITAGLDSLGNKNRSAQFPLTIHPDKIPATPGVNYVLPLGIVSTSPAMTISSNFGAILFNFYHNAYDGDYTSIGTRYNFNATADYTGWDPVLNQPLASSSVASAPTWNFPSSAVATVNAKISTIHVGNLNGGFGTVNISVNPSTNHVTLISTPATGLNAVINLQGTGAPASTWDPVTKKFDLYYQYQNIDASGNPTSFRVLHDVLTHN